MRYFVCWELLAQMEFTLIFPIYLEVMSLEIWFIQLYHTFHMHVHQMQDVGNFSSVANIFSFVVQEIIGNTEIFYLFGLIKFAYYLHFAVFLQRGQRITWLKFWLSKKYAREKKLPFSMCRSYMVISNGKEIFEVDGISIVIAKDAKIQQVKKQNKIPFMKLVNNTTQKQIIHSTYKFLYVTIIFPKIQILQWHFHCFMNQRHNSLTMNE